VPTRVKDDSNIVNKNSITGTDNNDGIDRPSINKNSIDNTSVSTSINKPNVTQSKINTNNINAKRAKFEEDMKKEPILQTIINVFDGELL
jgi:hypothetical protein